MKWYSPNETWSLKPFCGKSRCTILRNTKTNKTFLSEEVTDCGPLIDTEKTPECALLEDAYSTEADYPDCCPVYECQEGVEIVYKKKAGSSKKPRRLSDADE